MRRILWLGIVLVMTTISWSADFTVVLKNGKVMTGTLVSESGEVLVFKDEKGFQYSFKKSLLDLEKMEAANRQPEPAAPVEAPVVESAPNPAPEPVAVKKPVRTFTAADIDRMNHKMPASQPKVNPAQPVVQVSAPAPMLPEPAPPVDGIALSPADYAAAVQSSAQTMKEALDNIQTLAQSMMTSFEVTSSTGGNGRAALEQYMKGEEAAGRLKAIDESLNQLTAQASQLASPPQGYEKAYDTFRSGWQSLHEMRALLGAPKITTSTAPFKSRMTESSDHVVASITGLQPPP